MANTYGNHVFLLSSCILVKILKDVCLRHSAKVNGVLKGREDLGLGLGRGIPLFADSVCKIRGVRRGQTPKSMRDPCKVICRDPEWVP